MPKMVVSIDGVVIKEVQLVKERTTLGRRPYNDLVIDNLAISGEHAAFVLDGGLTWVEDLNSTNGTYVNGKAVRRQALNHGDLVELGKYQIRYLGEAGAASAAPAPHAPLPAAAAASGMPGGQPVGQPGGPSSNPSSAAPSPSASPQPATAATAVIEVLGGPAAGRTVPLTKVVTTLGKPGVAVASITHRGQGYALALVDGQAGPSLNGQAVGKEPVLLKHLDIIELAGTRMRFRLG